MTHGNRWQRYRSVPRRNNQFLVVTMDHLTNAEMSDVPDQPIRPATWFACLWTSWFALSALEHHDFSLCLFSVASHSDKSRTILQLSERVHVMESEASTTSSHNENCICFSLRFFIYEWAILDFSKWFQSYHFQISELLVLLIWTGDIRFLEVISELSFLIL